MPDLDDDAPEPMAVCDYCGEEIPLAEANQIGGEWPDWEGATLCNECYASNRPTPAPMIFLHDDTVSWCSDWSKIREVPGLKVVFGGPATYGQANYVVDGTGRHLPHVLSLDGLRRYIAAH